VEINRWVLSFQRITSLVGSSSLSALFELCVPFYAHRDTLRRAAGTLLRATVGGGGMQ
jgi:hypothetical protein